MSLAAGPTAPFRPLVEGRRSRHLVFDECAVELPTAALPSASPSLNNDDDVSTGLAKALVLFLHRSEHNHVEHLWEAYRCIAPYAGFRTSRQRRELQDTAVELLLSIARHNPSSSVEATLRAELMRWCVPAAGTAPSKYNRDDLLDTALSHKALMSLNSTDLFQRGEVLLAVSSHVSALIVVTEVACMMLHKSSHRRCIFLWSLLVRCFQRLATSTSEDVGSEDVGKWCGGVAAYMDQIVVACLKARDRPLESEHKTFHKIREVFVTTQCFDSFKKEDLDGTKKSSSVWQWVSSTMPKDDNNMWEPIDGCSDTPLIAQWCVTDASSFASYLIDTSGRSACTEKVEPRVPPVSTADAAARVVVRWVLLSACCGETCRVQSKPFNDIVGQVVALAGRLQDTSGTSTTPRSHAACATSTCDQLGTSIATIEQILSQFFSVYLVPPMATVFGGQPAAPVN